MWQKTIIGLFTTLIVASRSFAAADLPLDLVIAYAASQSNQSKDIKTKLLGSQSLRLRAEAPFATQLTSSATITNAQLATTSSFAPDEANKQNLKFGATRYLASGTQVGINFDYVQNDLTYPQLSNQASSFQGLAKYSETQTVVFARQNLLRDSFGSATSQNLDAVTASDRSTKAQMRDDLEVYITSLISQYFKVLELQAAYKAINERLKEQQKLSEVTKVKLQRGNAEETELLQIEGSIHELKWNLKDVKKSMQEIWNFTAISLGLPQEYLEIDVTKINLLFTDQTALAQNLCRNQTPQTSHKIDALGQSLEAANLRLSASKNLTAPTVYADLRFLANGIDESMSKSVQDSILGKNPSWSISLGIDWSIGEKIDRASLADAFKTTSQLAIQKESVKDQLEIEWRNECEKLDLQIKRKTDFTDQAKRQKRRLDLENQRFALGQTDVQAITLASNSLISMLLQAENATSAIQSSAWKIRYLAGTLDEHIKLSLQKIRKEAL